MHYVPNPAGFMRRPAGPVEYRIALAHGDDSIAVAGIGFTANIDRIPLRAQMQTCLTDDWFLDAFENLFRVIACYRLFGEGALVMHSAAFTDGARGFLFCGRSGAGKTTLCGLAEELELDILSDELNAVMPSERFVRASGDAVCRRFRRRPQAAPALPADGIARPRAGRGSVGAWVLESGSRLAYRRLVPLHQRRLPCSSTRSHRVPRS